MRNYNNSLCAAYYENESGKTFSASLIVKHFSDLSHELKTIKFSRQVRLYISFEMNLTADIERDPLQ